MRIESAWIVKALDYLVPRATGIFIWATMVLELQEVDLASFHLFSFSIYFPFVLFLACRTKIRGGMRHVT